MIVFLYESVFYIIEVNKSCGTKVFVKCGGGNKMMYFLIDMIASIAESISWANLDKLTNRQENKEDEK